MKRAPRCHLAAVLLLTALAMPSVVAAAQEEPRTCDPPCRKGYLCRAGQCISRCNPPCRPHERCTPDGECTPIVIGVERRPRNIIGLMGGYRAGLSDSARGTGELRLEFGGRYASLQIGPGFGRKVTSLRTAILVHVPFRVHPALPIYLEPTIALGHTFSWIDDAVDSRQQDIFLTPGLRVRYNPIPRLALFLHAIQVEITFLRLQGDQAHDFTRVDVVPVHWTTTAGVGFLY